MKASCLVLLSLLLCVPAAYGDTYGNLSGQESGDLLIRLLDSSVPLILNFNGHPTSLYQPHTAIYIGQTNQKETLPNLPYYHKAIQMTGVLDGGWTFDFLTPFPFTRVTKVAGIEFTDWADFKTAHPKYFGSFTTEQPDGASMTLAKRQKILQMAEYLRERANEIKYIVTEGDPFSKIFYSYFIAGKDGSGNNLANYTGDYGQIQQMRSDAFAEFCYASAGVPIIRDEVTHTPIYLNTHDGAQTLVNMSANFNLYPSYQQYWMHAAQTDVPALEALDKNGVPIPPIVDEVPVRFRMTDFSSGPGILKIHKEPYQSEYGREDFFPYLTELVDKGQILAGNIVSSTETVFSPKTGLSPGFYTATAYDHAGNASQEINFKIPELSAIKVKSASPLYDNFKGISATAPSTLERSHSFEFSESVAGVSAVSIDGPQGNLWSRTFDPRS